MTRILIVDSNGPGMPALAPGFAAVLQALSPQITCSFCAPYLGQALPEGAFDGVVLTGSAVSWGVDAPEGEVLREIWRQVTCWKVPIWGSCNGMQLAAFMLGGQCAASPHGDELGVAEAITLTDIGRGHPMMQGRASEFREPTVHRDEVQHLPSGACLLARNAHSEVQPLLMKPQISAFGARSIILNFHKQTSRLGLQAVANQCRRPKNGTGRAIYLLQPGRWNCKTGWHMSHRATEPQGQSYEIHTVLVERPFRDPSELG